MCIIRHLFYAQQQVQLPTFELLPEHRFIPEFTHFSHVIWMLYNFFFMKQVWLAADLLTLT